MNFISKFEAMVHAQRLTAEKSPIELDFEPAYSVDVIAPEGTTGFIENIDAQTIGTISLDLGAGRHTKADVLDFFAGVELLKVKGDEVQAGDVLMKLYANKEVPAPFVEKALGAIKYRDTAIDAKRVLKSKDLEA